jgi:hypothetical protein
MAVSTIDALYNGGSEKITATSTGIDVTGTVTADGLTVDGGADINGDLEVGAGGTGTKLLQINGSGSSTSVMDLEMRGGGTGNPTTILRHTSSTKDFSLLTGNYGSELTRLSVTEGGDISFYDNTGVTQGFFWDASTQNLGIGVTNPGTTLHIKGGTNENVMIVDATGTAANYIFDVRDDGTSKFRVDPSGNVGIGTSSPSSFSSFGNNLVVGNGSNNEGMTIYSSAVGSFYFSDGTTGDSLYKGIIQYSHTTDSLDLYANYASGDSPSMRIDGNGDVMVGKTTSDNTTQGIKLDGSGYASFTIPNDYPIIANRLSSDGDIAIFRKDGTTVGSIGATSGRLYIGDGTVALRIVGDADEITPWNATGNTNRDAAIALGNSTNRFTDLYLSNAVVQDGIKATTTATTQVAIETFAHADHDGAKVVITAATSADTYVTELLIATNGTTAVATEYGQIGTGSALATYDVDISGADVRILATPASTTSTTFRVAMTLT